MNIASHRKICALLLYIAISAVSALLEARNDKDNSYQCGDKIFSPPVIADALFLASFNIGKNPGDPPKYRGWLYNENLNYMIWPLKEDTSDLERTKATESPYQVVFNTEFRVIDVIALMKNHQHIKCSKLDRTEAARPNPVSWEGDGYRCGHQFFPDGRLEMIAALKNSKPFSYSGPLYGQEVRAMLLPIGSIPDTRRKENINPYHVVIDEESKVIGVMAQTIDSNFVKCQRSWSLNAAVKGYQCHKIFFEIGFIEESARQARLMSIEPRTHPFPIEVQDSRKKTHLVWPLSNNALFNKEVKSWPYWLLMTKNPLRMHPAIFEGNRFTPCKGRTIEGHDYYNRKAVNCGGTVFWEEQLNRAARLGCQSNLSFLKFLGRISRKKGTKFKEQLSTGNQLVHGISFNSCFSRKLFDSTD